MMSVFRYSILLLLSPIRWGIYFLGGFMPRSKNIWVFGAWDGYRFADNTKWFFLHCNNNYKEEKFIWITRDRKIAKQLRESGFLSYHYATVKGIWYSLRAKFYVLDHSTQDVNFFTSRNSILIYLFHGIPLKKLRRDINNKDNFNYKVFYGKWYEKLLLYITRPYVYEKMDYFAVTSPVNRKIFAKSFGLREDKLHIVGHTRNDVFLDSNIVLYEKDHETQNEIAKIKGDANKIILYLPTWRDHNREREDPINWERINLMLEKHNSILIPKLHSYDKTTINARNSYSNIHPIHHSVDIYPLLRLTDILITDYSSIAFDFMLTGRPIVYYCYDLEEYTSKSRKFYHDYSKITPGAKANNFEELLDSLEKAITEENYLDKWTSEYEFTINLLHTYKDAKSSERLYKDVKKKFVGP